MELLDKNLPSDLASTARDAAARAVHAIEPFAEPLLDPLRSHHSTSSRLRTAFTRHPWAIGATVVVLAGIAVVALKNTSSGSDEAAADTDGATRIRSAA